MLSFESLVIGAGILAMLYAFLENKLDQQTGSGDRKNGKNWGQYC